MQFNRNLLHHAAEFKALNAMDFLLEELKKLPPLTRVEFLNAKMNDESGGYAPLHAAVYGSTSRAVKKLMDAGATPFIHDADGSTPLHIAAKSGSLETVQELVKKGVRDAEVRRYEDGRSELVFTYESDQEVLNRINLASTVGSVFTFFGGRDYF